MNKINITKIISSILLLMLFVGALGMISHFTNGFKEEFKTFYVTYAGEDILSEKSTLKLPRGEEHRFEVTYMFEGLEEELETKEYYVEIISNVEKGKEFEYTIDGEKIAYVDGMYLTKAFQIDIQDRYFIITIPKDLSLEKVLESIHERDMEVPKDEELPSLYLYTLVITSYDETVRYYIDFALDAEAIKIQLYPSEVVF